MARKSKESTLVVGVIGTGSVTGTPGVEALVAQFVEANGPVRFVVPFSEEFFTESISALADWSLEEGIPVRGIVHPSFTLDETWLSDLDGPPHETALVRKELEKQLLEADEAALIVLWDYDDREGQATCLRLHQEGIPLYEMSSGLAEIESLELNGDEEDTAQPQPEKEPTVAQKEDTTPEADEEFVPYTRDELEEIAETDREALKTIAAEDFSLDLPPRTRNNTIIDAILKAQEEEGLVGDDEPDENDEPEEKPAKKKDTAPAGSIDEDALVDRIVEAIVDETSDLIKDLVAPIVSELESLQGKVDDLQQRSTEAALPDPEKATPVRRRRRA